MKYSKLNLLVLISFLTVTFFVISCAKVYYSPEAESASKRHKIIAIAMPKVSIPPQKNMDTEALKLSTHQTSESFHSEMVSWLLKRKNEGKINVNILDANTTQVKLSRLMAEKGGLLTPEEIIKELDVDAIIVPSFKMTKPMSTSAAVVTTLLFGFGTTNQAISTMELYDRNLNRSIWNFQHTVSGGILNSAEQCINEIMRIASKKLPYTKYKAI